MRAAFLVEPHHDVVLGKPPLSVHISPKYLSNIERGRENPTLDTLIRLGKSLKVELWEMFMLEQEGLDSQALRGRLARLLEQTKDEEQLRLIMRVLQAALH